MASYKLRKFRDVAAVEAFLNGGVVGAAGARGLGLYGLAGQTLVFTSPSSFTCTFVADPGRGQTLTFASIKSQIEVASGNVVLVAPVGPDGCLGIIEKIPSLGITISHTSTASAALGFQSGVDVVGKIYKINPTVPYVFSIYPDVQSSSHIVTTVE